MKKRTNQFSCDLFRSLMKQNYIQLLNLNRDLINGYRIRSTNHEE